MKTPFAVLTVLSFLMTGIIGPMPAYAQDEFHLPAPGVMIRLSPPLDPPMLKGIKVHPDNPFRFDFILDQGDSSVAGIQNQEQIKTEATRLIKYFLASLTIPENDLWVNLSPYEKDRIIPQSFGQTEMGRDLLAEDYMLKQITASLIYPEDAVGKKFWKRIYEEAENKFGTTNIPVNTFNKVWIVPEKAVVYENVKAGTAYVVEAKLKVMLEQDYLSLAKHQGIQSEQSQSKDTNQLGSQIVREIVIPELTKEVNQDKNFAQLRQVYNSLILATWYKKKIKDSILAQVYEGKRKVAGVGYGPNDIEAIYQRYLQAFKKGVFNYIKEDAISIPGMPSKEQGIFPRKYFSGGVNFLGDLAMTTTSQEPSSTTGSLTDITANFQPLISPLNRRNFLRSGGMALAATFFSGRLNAEDIDKLFQKLKNPKLDYQNRKEYLEDLLRHESPAVNQRINEYLQNFGLQLLSDAQDKFRLLDPKQEGTVKKRIEGAKYVSTIDGYNINEAGGNVDFQIDKRQLVLALKGSFIHEIGHNILEMKGAPFYRDIKGDISPGYKMLHEFYAELFEVAYFGDLASEKGTIPEHQWAFSHVNAIEKLLKSEKKIGDLNFLQGLLRFTAKEIAENVNTDKTISGAINAEGVFDSVKDYIKDKAMKAFDPRRRWVLKTGAAATVVGLAGPKELFSFPQEGFHYTPTDMEQIKAYKEGYYFGYYDFDLYVNGKDKRKALESQSSTFGSTGNGFIDFYDQLRYQVHEELIKEGQVSKERIIALENEIENEMANGKNVSPYRQYGLEGFFKGIWSDYIVALANNQEELELIRKDLIYQAQKHSAVLGDMMHKITLMIGPGSSDEERDNFLEEWASFNETYFIPKNYYVDIRVESAGSRGLKYFSNVYKVVAKEFRKVNGTDVQVIYGRKMDRVYSAGDLGDSFRGHRLVFIDLNDIDSEIKRITETLASGGKRPYILFEGDQPVSATELVIKIFTGKDKDYIREFLLHGTRAHEFFHQAQDMLKYPYKGTDRFGLPADTWERVDPEQRKSLDNETGAMLAQIISAKEPGLGLFDVFKFALSRQNISYYFGALWIMNRLDGRAIDRWTDGQDSKELIKQFMSTYALGADEIRNRAEKLMEDNWSKELLDAVVNANSAMLIAPSKASTGGIDLTPANMNIQVKTGSPTGTFGDDSGGIKFHLDPAMLQELQNAPGFEPVIISVQPLKSLQEFLGLTNAS